MSRTKHRTQPPVSSLCAIAFCILLCAPRPHALAETVTVRHPEGTVHAFLALRSSEGRQLAVGDLTQVVRGDRVTVRLLFHFKDGSVDDETSVYSQRKVFRLITNHHIQKGPFFPHPMELSIDTRNGQVAVKSAGKDGKDEIVTEHMDLPPDLVNGFSFTVAKNLLPRTAETKVSMIVATPKPRLIKLAYDAREEEPFFVGGFERKAMRIEIKVELGGVAGVVAPLVGKQPPDPQMWVTGGEAPAFVKEEGFLYEGGPVLSIVMASPEWPRADNRVKATGN